MIQWKQRLYAFLIRRVLGPFLDATAAQKLHDSIDVSLQEGKFVLKDVSLDAAYLTERLSDKIPGLSIRKARVERLEINLTLRENIRPTPNGPDNGPNALSSTAPGASGGSSSTQSSLAWRAIKFGTMNDALPAVSLIAEIKVDGVFLELVPIELRKRPCRTGEKAGTAPSTKSRHGAAEEKGEDSSSSASKSVIGSYIDAALASLQLTFNLTNVQVKLISPPRNNNNSAATTDRRSQKEVWVAIRISSFVYKDLDTTEAMETTAPPSSSSYNTVVNKYVEFSDLLLQAGEAPVDHERISFKSNQISTTTRLTPVLSTVALAQGNGQVILRVVEYDNISLHHRSGDDINETNTATTSSGSNHSHKNNHRRLQQDIEVKLNHQMNLSVDHTTLLLIMRVGNEFSDISETNQEVEDGDVATIFRESTLRNNPYIESDDMDREDLKALTGIMRQYREAYHLAEHNQLRGGILVPSNAYLDEGHMGVDEIPHDDATFDVFFDANEQSFYKTASVLSESIRLSSASNDYNEDANGISIGLDHEHVHTKLRLHLLSGCLKVVFRSPGHVRHYSKPDEYILVTANDISLSMSSTKRTSELILGVLHFEVEDAQQTKASKSRDFVSVGGSPVFEGSVEIGTIMSFRAEASDGRNDEYDDDVLVSQAPCVNLHWKSSRGRTNGDDLYCNVSILPLEVFFRHRTMSNLAKFGSLIRDGSAALAQTTISSLHETRIPDGDNKRRKHLVVSCSCPSITLSTPLLKQVDTGPLFDRSGVVVNDAATRESCLGIVLDNTGFELTSDSGDSIEPGQPILIGQFSCHHVLLFATALQDKRLGFESRTIRKDILAVTGRLEVHPYIPVSVNYVKAAPGGKDTNPGRESFPIVPAISSFKARQEDDDEDIKTDSLLFSNLREANVDSKKELRGTDPQISMLSDAEKCNSIVSIDVPEIILDLTKEELVVLLRMLDAAKPASETEETRQSPCSSSTESLVIAVNCNVVTLSLSDGWEKSLSLPETDHPQAERFSCLLAIDRIKVHILLVGSTMKHLRFLSHDPCVYAAYGQTAAPLNGHQRNDTELRVSTLKEGIKSYSQATVVPILFRSHLFTPISHETPSILIDMINLTTDLSSTQKAFKQTRVHLTLYHLTFRYNVDSDWIQKLSNMCANAYSEGSKDFDVLPIEESVLYDTDESSMTRLFVTCADINMDYQSPRYFETVSRSIIRVGDFRFSSNLVKPAGLVQAYSLSVGDVNCHISSTRNPYDDENMRLCRSSLLIPNGEISRKSCSSSVFGTMPEAILRELGFVNVLSLDMMDSIVAKRNSEMVVRNTDSNEPLLSTSITLGLLSIHSCKDSFECFASTVGELQAKLTAITAQDMEVLKDSYLSTQKRNASVTRTTDARRSETILKDSETFLPELKNLAGIEKGVSSFPLDGYEWTTIDHDPLKQIEIPSSDEQVAGWYNSDRSNLSGSFPSRVIQQHFPFHAIADPLAEGDMGVRKYVGKAATFAIKSRLLIHKLNLRIRFFDGYDWPDKCTFHQKESAMRSGKAFVIEPLPREVLLEKKKKLANEIGLRNKRSLTKKAQLMGELLDSEQTVSDTFDEAPLPEDRASTIDRQKLIRVCSRRPNVFFQLSGNGVTLRVDSYDMSDSHRLRSIMELAVSSLFVAETVSISRPVKMVGEWINDQAHPRDTRFGTLMLKMATWAPQNKLTVDNELESDDCEVTVQLSPMRCLLDQRAIMFIRAFSNGDNNDENELEQGKSVKNSEKWSDGLHLVPSPRFKMFKVKPWKVKVDYNPNKVDVAALREGSIVELVNISPIQRMVITLSEVTVVDSLGGGPAFSQIVGSWVKEICSTQLHKFLANASPFEPFTDVGQGLTDLVVLPYEAFKQGENITRAMANGVMSLAETVAFQTLTTTSGLTKYAADLMAVSLGGNHPNSAANPLPARPLTIPRGIGDVRRHAAESLARGFQAANYKVIVVPYREFSRNGVTGAVTSVIRGIPVLLVAPLAGTTESLSYTLLGARNSLRPDIRKEEEASMNLH